MSADRVIVLKFGGSVLLEESGLEDVAHEVRRWRDDGWRVVAVVSALAGLTESLLERCDALHRECSGHIRAGVVANGELQSASLLGLYLDRAGVASSVLSPGGVGLLADGDPLDAVPTGLVRAPIVDALKEDGVVVFPGFIALDGRGRTVVLGRGGSDLTALFLAHQLGSRCRLVKDVDGLYEWDPAKEGPSPRRYAHATWADALATDGSIIQHKAVRFAKSHGITFELGRIGADVATQIGGGETRFCGGEPLKQRTVGGTACMIGGGMLTYAQ